MTMSRLAWQRSLLLKNKACKMLNKACKVLRVEWQYTQPTLIGVRHQLKLSLLSAQCCMVISMLAGVSCHSMPGLMLMLNKIRLGE